MAISLIQKESRVAHPQASRGLWRVLLSVEWKLFLRNRRPRLLLIFYGCLALLGALRPAWYNTPDGWFVMYVMMTCPLLSTLSWRSTFYEGLLARPVSESDVARIIVYVLHLCVVLFFGLSIIASTLVQGDWGDLSMIGASFLYVLGVVNYLLAFVATAFMSGARIDMNLRFRDVGHGDPYREVPVSRDAVPYRWIVPVFWLLVVLSAALIVSVGFFSQTREIVFPAMAVLGLAGLFFHARWLRLLTHVLHGRRYELLERFRGV